ncbi:hypothetical protein ACVWYJ_000514 [Bradyrhizobium sp. USDA 4471]
MIGYRSRATYIRQLCGLGVAGDHMNLPASLGTFRPPHTVLYDKPFGACSKATRLNLRRAFASGVREGRNSAKSIVVPFAYRSAPYRLEFGRIACRKPAARQFVETCRCKVDGELGAAHDHFGELVELPRLLILDESRREQVTGEPTRSHARQRATEQASWLRPLSTRATRDGFGRAAFIRPARGKKDPLEH